MTSKVENPNKILDIDEIVKILQDKVNFYIISKMRTGIYKQESFSKLLRVKFSKLKKTLPQKIEELLEKKIIKKTKVSNESEYLVLTKDFVVMRKPPRKMMDLIEESNLSQVALTEYFEMLKDYFGKYQKKLNLGDDLSVLELYENYNAFRILDYLRYNFIQSNKIPKKLITISGGESKFNEQIEFLKSKDFIHIIKERKPEIHDIILIKTDVEIKQIFPEYLVNAIEQQYSESRISKKIALSAMQKLKESYLELHPEFSDATQFQLNDEE